MGRVLLGHRRQETPLLFLYSLFHNAALQRAIQAAVASHRPCVLRELLGNHGSAAFAKALAPLSSRVAADALSMLTPGGRAAVYPHLPRKHSILCSAKRCT